MITPFNLVTIIGHTAAGKTSVATHLAYQLDSEVISGDSRQVYKGMDLGTGKDIDEYIINDKQIPYHLIDILPAGYKYNVYEFQNDFFKAFKDITDRNKLPVFCGGTGMYVESVLKGYKLVAVPDNPELRVELGGKSLEELTSILMSFDSAHNKSDFETKRRAIRAIEIQTYYNEHGDNLNVELPKINNLLVGIYFDRESRRSRITERLHQRLELGMVDEVRQLIDSGVNPDDLVYYGLEYKFLTLYITGKLSYDEMVSQLNIAIHQFAKRQMTWFRKMENSGFDINWINGETHLDEKINIIQSLLNK